MINLSNKKILLVRNDNIGDLTCTTPAIEALRKKYPNSQIDIVVNSYNYNAIHGNPFINNIHCYTKPKHENKFTNKIKALVGKIAIMLQIKKQNYDVVIVFRSGYSKSAELFSRITKAKYKVGVKNKYGKDDFNIYTQPKSNQHEVEFCFECLSSFGIIYNAEHPKYFIRQELATQYKKYQNFIVFHISSRVIENQYSPENFKQVINSINHDMVIITAEPQDIMKARWLEKHTKATFVKTTSLIDLANLIADVKLFITLDGGITHIASALNVKIITISGKTNMEKWHPWGYKDLLLQDKSRVANNIHIPTIVDLINKHT